MKKYVKPEMDSELFVSNDYIGACYFIACDYAKAPGGIGPGTNLLGGRLVHRMTGCGNQEKQSIQVFSGDLEAGTATVGIVENDATVQGNYVGDLTCYFIPREGVQQKGTETLSNVGMNQEFYWVTNVGLNYGDCWMPHKGKITHIDENRPNHS